MEKVFIYLTDLSGNAAYAIIFGILVACGLGFPLPEDIPLVATGYLVWDGTMRWFPAISITLTGVLIGDTILFYLGHKLGHRRLQVFFSAKKIRRTRAYFRKYGDKIIFFARFVAGIRAVAFFLAGAMRMKYRKFIWLDALAALVSVPVWIVFGYGLGYYLGDEITKILQKVKHFKNIFSLLILIILVAMFVQIYLKYHRRPKNLPIPRKQ